MREVSVYNNGTHSKVTEDKKRNLAIRRPEGCKVRRENKNGLSVP